MEGSAAAVVFAGTTLRGDVVRRCQAPPGRTAPSAPRVDSVNAPVSSGFTSRGVVTDIGWGTIGAAISKVGAFGAGVLLARTMAPDEYGLYLAVSTAALLATPLADAGFTPLVFRLVSESHGQGGFARRAARQRLRYWIPALLAGAVLGLLGGRNTALVVIAAGITAGSQSQIDLTASELQGSGRFKSAALLRMMLGLVFLALAIVVAAVNPIAMAAFAAFALSRLVVAAIATTQQTTTAISEKLSWRDAGMLGAIGLVTTVYVQSDIVLLAWLGIDRSEVAVYAVGYSILIGLQLLPAAVAAALFPRVALSGLSSRRYPRALGLFAFVLCATVSLLSLNGALVFGIFGPFYRLHFDIGLPLITLVVPIGLNTVLASSLQARHRERDLFRLSILALVLNLGLNLLLIPRFGTQGALSATATVEALVLLRLTWMARAEGASSSLSRHFGLPVGVTCAGLVVAASNDLRVASVLVLTGWFGGLLLVTRWNDLRAVSPMTEG